MPRRSLPPLSSLRAFEAFARCGSMTGAADELCVTHGAISRQVRGLEAQLAVRLIDGPRHQLRLTEAGRELAAAVTSALDMMAGALPGAGPAEEIVVSCYGTLAMKWLIPRLPGFLDSHPGVRVRIVESHAAVDFSQGGIHAAVRIEGADWPKGSRVTPFMAHSHGPVLSPALLAETGGDPQRLLALPRLHSETFRSAWTAWTARAGYALPSPPVERGFEHNSYMLEAAAAGLGVAVTPWAFAALEIERGRLAAPFGFEPLDQRFVFVQPRLGDNPAANLLSEWLREEGRRCTQPPPPLRSVE